jgi:hypothetical protein
MKRILPAIALIAGLSLVGCSGGQDGGDKQQHGGDAGAEQTEEAPQPKKLDETQLKDILESTDADGLSFKPIDTSGASGSEAIKALEKAEYEPSECKDLSMAILNANEASDNTTVNGVSSDNTMSVGLVSLNDDEVAVDHVKTSSAMSDRCGDVTMKSQGIEMHMKFEPFEANVAGADETVGVKATIEADGQTFLNSNSITARVGNNVVTAANVTDVDESKVSKTAESFVDAVQNAG